MLINSLCALALGYVLDMAFGDPAGKLYPPNWIRAAVVRLEDTLRKAYADYAEARTMAGVMLIVLILAAVIGSTVVLTWLMYKLSVVTGIIFEGILCYYAISVRSVRTSLSGITRAAQKGNVSSGRRYLSKLSSFDTEELETEQIVKCAVEASAEAMIHRVVAPIFWICLLGGVGGAVYRAVDIIAEEVGHPTENYRYFGKVPAGLNRILTFVPARIAAYLMRLNAAFLGLDGKSGWSVRKEQGGIKAHGTLQTVSLAAGILGLGLGGREKIKGEEVDLPAVGTAKHPPHSEDVFWMNQLITGVSAYGIILAAIVRVGLFLIFR